MIRDLRNALAASAAAALFIVPAQTLAASQLSYTTTLQRTGPTALASEYYPGSLALTIESDGMVRGWYKPQDGQFVPVAGSLKDNKLWLEVGDNGNLQIYATQKPDGTFDGNATDVGQAQSLNPLTFSFEAQPGSH